jgi:hypothetical protein
VQPKDANYGLTVTKLKDVLRYDEVTGIFTRLRRTGETRPAGFVSRNDGYVRIKIGTRAYMGHRLAWFYTHEAWPEKK